MEYEPKYIMIKKELLKQITSGEMKEGDKLPSEASLQKLFSASRHTIRSALSALEQEGIIVKEQGLGSFVAKENIHHFKTIGVITTYVSDYIFPNIIRGIESEISKEGFTMILASTDNDIELEERALKMMISRKVDAIIVEPTKSAYFNPNISLYLKLKKNNIPIIMLNAFYAEVPLPFVMMDDYLSGYLATEYLIELGHSQIGGIFKIDDKQGKERLRGFVQACYDKGVKYNTNCLLTYETESYGSLLDNKVDKMISEESNITSMVCYNDKVAIDLINKLRLNNIECPRDLSIVSHDNSSLSTISETKFTSMDHPKVEMGRYAAKEIIRKIKEPAYEMQPKIYEPKIIIRDSVKDLRKK